MSCVRNLLSNFYFIYLTKKDILVFHDFFSFNRNVYLRSTKLSQELLGKIGILFIPTSGHTVLLYWKRFLHFLSAQFDCLETLSTKSSSQCDQILKQKVAQVFLKVIRKCSLTSLTSKVMVFTTAQRVTSHLGYICCKFVAKKFQNCPIWSHWFVSNGAWMAEWFHTWLRIWVTNVCVFKRQLFFIVSQRIISMLYSFNFVVRKELET